VCAVLQYPCCLCQSYINCVITFSTYVSTPGTKDQTRGRPGVQFVTTTKYGFVRMALRKGHAEMGTSWRFVYTRMSITQRKFQDKYTRTHYPTLRLDVTNSNVQTWNWTTDSSFSSFPSKMQAHLSFMAAVVLYILTAWSRVLLEKLTGFQLVKKFPAFMELEGSLTHS